MTEYSKNSIVCCAMAGDISKMKFDLGETGQCQVFSLPPPTLSLSLLTMQYWHSEVNDSIFIYLQSDARPIFGHMEVIL